MTGEPGVPPGATPVPVIIVQAPESVWDKALTIATFLAFMVTVLGLMIEIHKDHAIIQGLIRTLAKALPPYRRTPGDPPTD
jgi:hypothetical protein